MHHIDAKVTTDNSGKENTTQVATFSISFYIVDDAFN
jgi:hypothetical protein